MITSIQLFKESLQHNKNLYRSTSQQWLINLLTYGFIVHDGDNPRPNKEWIALSQDYRSGGQDHYGNCHITFNEDMLYKQGAIEIDYEDMEFWKQYPTITQHVTGYQNAQDYYNSKGYSGPDEANKNLDLTWEQYVEDYSVEEEVVIEKITYQTGLIELVTFNEEPEQELLNLLKQFNIQYKLSTVLEKGVSFNTKTQMYDFDFKKDRNTDIMHLQPLHKRTKMMHHEGVNYQYYYAYHFEDGSHPGFLRAIKYIDNIKEKDATKLVENAVSDLCSKYNIQEYDTMLYPKSSSKILERFANVLGEQGIISTFIPNAFVKNSVENIHLDEEAVNKLPDATKKQVQRVLQHIKDMKTEFKLKDVFTRYRKFIKNFIKLDKDIIQHVEGKKVILMDDYHTTGATSKEMLNILFALKPVEVLIIFLVKVK